MSTLVWGTRNEQNHIPSLSCLLPARALDPLSLPAPFPFAPVPKSRPPTHLRLRSPPPTAAPQLPASRAPAGLTFFCYWLQSPPARKVPPRPVRRPLAAPPARGKWPITKVITPSPRRQRRSRVSRRTHGRQSWHTAGAGLRCCSFNIKGSTSHSGLLVLTVSKLVKHLELFLGLESATRENVAYRSLMFKRFRSWTGF